MTTDRRDIAALLIEIIGIDDALALMRHPAIGGRTMVFSKGMRSDGMDSFLVVAGVIGDEKARQLANHLDGEPVYVPNCARQITAQRHAEWRSRYDSLLATCGSARRAIAALKAETGASDRWLWEITGRADPQEDDRQMGLF